MGGLSRGNESRGGGEIPRLRRVLSLWDLILYGIVSEQSVPRLFLAGILPGLVVTAVLSTRIYCRPSCPVRPPLVKNMTFYPTAAAATGIA